MDIRKSIALFAQAQDVMVGGVNSPVRSFRSVGGNPLVMRSGKGSKLYDQDGNAYTDYCLSWGALIYGHAHRNVVLAAKRAVERGTSFGTTTRPEIEIAGFITRCVPSMERIRFVNSGTEATMSAIRLARGFTGRNLLIKFDGCYHGHFDDLLACAGSGVANLQASSSLGVPPSHLANTISLPFNDVTALVETMERNPGRIAAVIIEPVAGNMGVIPAREDFLRTLRELTRKHGIVLIFDEIMTGFRTSLGCVQGDVGITPDLTCLGKIIGGGFPIGAYGGRKDIMACLAPLGGVYQAGTFSGNPVVMRAGLAALKLLNSDFYRSLNQRSEEFALQVNESLAELPSPARLTWYRSMQSIRFSTDKIGNYSDAQKACGGPVYAELFQFLLANGVYWPPADLESFFISGMHTRKDLQFLAELLQKFFRNKQNA